MHMIRTQQTSALSLTLELLGAVRDEPQRQTRVGAAAVARNDQIAAAQKHGNAHRQSRNHKPCGHLQIVRGRRLHACLCWCLVLGAANSQMRAAWRRAAWRRAALRRPSKGKSSGPAAATPFFVAFPLKSSSSARFFGSLSVRLQVVIVVAPAVCLALVLGEERAEIVARQSVGDGFLCATNRVRKGGVRGVARTHLRRAWCAGCEPRPAGVDRAARDACAAAACS